MTTEKTESNLPQQTVRPQAKRRRWLRLSFVLFVLLPVLLGTIYTTFVASDRYVAGTGFAVRSMKKPGGDDFLGAFTGLSSGGSAASDSYILLKYLSSRDLLERLEQDFGFREVYGSNDLDWLSRLNPKLDIENVLTYWNRQLQTSYDPTSGIINFEVKGFAAEDAQRVAQLVLGYAQDLVNELSEKARIDAMSFAKSEVARAEARQLESLRKIRAFRERTAFIDPAASAMAQIEMLAVLEKQLLDIRVRMVALGETVDDNAPSLGALRRQAEAIEQQIAEKNGGNNMEGSTEGLSDLLAKYEELQIEKSFAKKIYSSALISLEAARVEAGRQQRYLAVYSQPALPESPLYPRKVLSPFLLVIVMSGLWGIGTLIVYSVRDHLS